jgi:3',5'-nucleoside bisphosphate phosphatase
MDNSFRADLHVHSICSDGSSTPQELLILAQKANLAGISITDHDTLDAYTSDLLDLAKHLGIYLLPGVEISASLNGKTTHILAYGRKLLCDVFFDFLQEIQFIRKDRNRKILENLSKIGFKITEYELIDFAKKYTKKKGKTIGRPHIALLMKQKGYVKTIQEAFNVYLGDNKKCFASGMKSHPKEIIDKIHACSGYAVIAHPHFYRDLKFVETLLNLPFDGIECYYSMLNSCYEKKWLEIARKNNLIITGGSDFHGIIKPNIQLGSSWVDRETFFNLYE